MTEEMETDDQVVAKYDPKVRNAEIVKILAIT